MNEQEYLRYYQSELRATFPRSEHTVDVALFTVQDATLSVLLVQRGEHPGMGMWALPGGFVRLGNGGHGEGEDLEQAALRELAEETGLEVFPGHLEQLKTYGGRWRDRRGRVFSTAYVALMPAVAAPQHGGDAAGSRFFGVTELPELAFDHDEIVTDALDRVRAKLEYEGALAASFLSEQFTVPELRRVYEAVWGFPVHRGDFRRKVLSVDGFLVATGDKATETGGPPAELYRVGQVTRLHPPIVRDAMAVKEAAC